MLSLIIVALFASCEKDELENLQPNECAEMLYFENRDELANELTNIFNASREEKVNWERTKGFCSLGIQIDEFYESFDPESFENEEEALAFIEENYRYIEEVEEDGEFYIRPRYKNNLCRYIMNEQGLFQMGDSVFKVLKNCVVSVSFDNIDKIKEIEDVNVTTFENDDEVFIIKKAQKNEKSAPQCGDGSYGESKEVKIGTRYYKTTDDLDLGTENMMCQKVVGAVYIESLVRRFGLWWGHKTKIYSDVDWVVNFKSDYYGCYIDRAFSYDSITAEKVKVLSYIKSYNASQLGNVPDQKYREYSLMGKTDAGAGSSVTISCGN